MTVSLGGSPVLLCTGTIHSSSTADQQHVEGRKTEGQLVAKWSQGKFTAGPGYEGRVQLSKEGIENGYFSLIVILPVEYRDEDSYDCFSMFETLPVANLEVLGATAYTILVCYVAT
ncbi:hypothetical protein GN956_G23817 [Arapaima gigas]